MPLKKRMFRSNMAILFSALESLLAIMMLVLVAFEDSIERDVQNLEMARLDVNVAEAAALLSGWTPSGDGASGEDTAGQTGDWSDRILGQAQELGYETAVFRGNTILAGNSEERMQELIGQIEEEGLFRDQVEIFYYQNATVVGRYDEQADMGILAVHFPEENWLISSLEESFRTLLAVLLFISAGAIAVLLILSSFFTGRMNRMVMEPLEELVKGAERIRNGNLKEKISYRGEKEFEDVCRTFNSMQDTILEDKRRQEQNEKARTDMVVGISHDLRTPLTSIQGYMKGILDGVADTEEKKRKYLKTAYEASKDMNVLLQKLFDFSRLESGNMPFHMVHVELLEYMNAYVARQEVALSPAQVRFHVGWEGEYLPDILLDPEQFQSVLDNLLENSRKYSEAEPVTVWLNAGVKGSWVYLEWKDNGPGVPEEKLGFIFDRFYRCDEARSQKGSGVGLYVVKYIMERHGGEIQAENDKGLKLTLLFPAAEKNHGENTDC